MRRPDLVLDTNALADRTFAFWLRTYPGRRILPVVAYAEAAVYQESRGRLEGLRGLLRQAGIEVEWMRAEEAETAAATGARAGDFAENARDHLIAAHAADPNRFLVTRNVRDFTFLSRVVSPAEAMQRFGTSPRRTG